MWIMSCGISHQELDEPRGPRHSPDCSTGDLYRHQSQGGSFLSSHFSISQKGGPERVALEREGGREPSGASPFCSRAPLTTVQSAETATTGGSNHQIPVAALD